MSAATIPSLDTKIRTPYNNQINEQSHTLKSYLLSQAAFSTVIGLVCRLPLIQSAALGLAAEGCRYVTDKAIDQLSSRIAFIEEHKAIIKTALVAVSFLMAHTLANALVPGSTDWTAAIGLMTVTYLIAEPIAKRFYESFTSNNGIKKTFIDIKNDIWGQYPSATQKISDFWDRIFARSA